MKDNRIPERHSYRGMMSRCYNPNASNYARYGGMGIEVCVRWKFGEDGKTGFQCFLEDMGVKPSPRHSLDRYSDKNGDYTPSNCKWSSPLEQQLHKRRLKMKTQYPGVYYDSRRNLFRAQISILGKSVYLGRFATAEDAAIAFSTARSQRTVQA